MFHWHFEFSSLRVGRTEKMALRLK